MTAGRSRDQGVAVRRIRDDGRKRWQKQKMVAEKEGYYKKCP